MIISASSLWRIEKCPASAVLPHKRERYADAERGKKEHAELEASPPLGSIPEVAFAYDVTSSRAREVGRSIGRNYGELAEGEIPGTADLVTIAEHACYNEGAVDALDFIPCPGCDEGDAGHVLITDYKTGVGYNQAEPALNPQLQHNALCAALVYGKPRAIVQLIYTKTGEVKDAEFDLFDFAAIRDRLKTIWHRAKVAEVALAMGSDFSQFVVPDNQVQCWRCPAKAACPVMGKQRKVANG